MISNQKNLFEDLRRMMYGFGDSENPKDESVEFVE